MQGRTLNHLLRRLKALRAESGMTQEQFAERAGLSYKYYQQVEAGRKPDLRLSTLERLARAYRLEVWQLLAPDEGSSRTRKARRAG
jgi:transcriptional regulator with XRE-family HTH domain